MFRRMHWVWWLWPGLRSLWANGSWLGLAAAGGAAVFLDAALVTTLVWTELAAESVRTGLWVAVAAAWLAGALGAALRAAPGLGQPADSAIEALFVKARDHYLGGDWFETERVLADLLGRHPGDVEARLMLATLLRRAGRIDEAADQLDWLGKLEGSERWQWEIETEAKRLRAAASGGATHESTGRGNPPPAETDRRSRAA